MATRSSRSRRPRPQPLSRSSSRSRRRSSARGAGAEGRFSARASEFLRSVSDGRGSAVRSRERPPRSSEPEVASRDRSGGRRSKPVCCAKAGEASNCNVSATASGRRVMACSCGVIEQLRCHVAGARNVEQFGLKHCPYSESGEWLSRHWRTVVSTKCWRAPRRCLLQCRW